MNHHVPTFSQRGFTLVEMLVVLAIIGVVLAVTINGQRVFDSSIVLSNTAYDVALSVRQAQTYGVSGRVARGTSDATYGYGVDVQSMPTNKYVLFADTADTTGINCSATVSSINNAPDTKTGDCVYTAGKDVSIQSVQINNHVTITGTCVYKGSSGFYRYCSTGTSPLLSQVDISFVRPNPGAIIIAIDSSGAVFKKAGIERRFNHVCIRLSAQGGNRYIMVNHIGIISVLSTASAKFSCKGLL